MQIIKYKKIYDSKTGYCQKKATQEENGQLKRFLFCCIRTEANGTKQEQLKNNSRSTDQKKEN